MVRPRKPTAIKELQGTIRPCRVNGDEPKPQNDISTILPPKHLNEKAREIWNFAVEQMPKGIVTTCDIAIFERWVVLYDQFIRLSEVLNEQGLIQIDDAGVIRVNPIQSVVIKVSAELRGIESQLGFTPASRSKVSAISNDNENTNPFMEL